MEDFQQQTVYSERVALLLKNTKTEKYFFSLNSNLSLSFDFAINSILNMKIELIGLKSFCTLFIGKSFIDLFNGPSEAWKY